MKTNLLIIILICFAFCMISCGGSSDTSTAESASLPEENGPLAGIWIGSTNGVTHTITIDGQGNVYVAAWDTSDACFTSDSGTTVHLDSHVEILCSGYDDDRQSYLYLSIYGEYDGENTIGGQVYAEECGAHDEPIVLNRLAD